MNDVQLPPGVVIPKTASVPKGQASPDAIPAAVRFHLMRCTVANEQKVSADKQTFFKSSMELQWSCYQYFEWCEQNPLYKLDTRFSAQHGRFYQAHVPQRRIFTEQALCIFLGISVYTWKAYAKNPDFKNVVNHVNDIMYHQKLEGAAVDHFNASIMTRHLGLADKQEVAVAGQEQEQITEEMSPEEAAEIYAKEREVK